MDYKPSSLKHKFSIDAILGISQTNFISSEIKQNLKHAPSGTSWTQQKTESYNSDSFSGSPTEIKKTNYQKVHNYPSSQPSFPNHLSTDCFRKTLSLLNTTKTNKPDDFDSAKLVGPEMTKNRSPRIPFSRVQLQTLEKKFQQTHYLSGWEVNYLAKKLNLSDTRVKIWFQNRRARERRDTGVSNNTDTKVYQPEYEPRVEIDTKMMNTRWQTLEPDKNLNSLTFSNYLDTGPFRFINPTDVCPVQIETTTNSQLLYNSHQPFGYPLRLNSNNWNPSLDLTYHPIIPRPIYSETNPTTTSPKLLYQPVPEHSLFSQSSFWKSYNHHYALNMESCNSNSDIYAKVDES